MRPDRIRECDGWQGHEVTFEGSLDLKPGVLGSLGKLEGLLSGFVEFSSSRDHSRNLRSVVEAAAAFRPASETPGG